jgi:hypothetical protein
VQIELFGKVIVRMFERKFGKRGNVHGGLSVRRKGDESGIRGKHQGRDRCRDRTWWRCLEKSSIRSRSGHLMVHGARSSERCENNDVGSTDGRLERDSGTLLSGESQIVLSRELPGHLEAARIVSTRDRFRQALSRHRLCHVCHHAFPSYAEYQLQDPGCRFLETSHFLRFARQPVATSTRLFKRSSSIYEAPGTSRMLHSVQVLTTQSNRPSSNGSSSAVCTRRSTSMRPRSIRCRASHDIPTPGSTAVRRRTRSG